MAQVLGGVCLAAALAALLRPPRRHVVPAHAGTHAEHAATRPPSPPHHRPVVPAQAGTHAEHPATRHDASLVAARSLHHAAALLALSVLLDSAIEHYRGHFENPGMFAPLAASLAASWAGARAGHTRANGTIYATALATGLAGTAFHAYNLARRPGGLCWQNLFYAAPLGAPAALVLAGAYGLAATRVASKAPATLLGMPSGRALSGLTAIGIAGTVAEAGMLHFRGAYHRPAMWLPVTLPPLSVAFLLRAASGARDRLARACLGLTALLGVAGVAFHANGIARQMGGWRNWRQNLLSGPPLPAPPSFLALAIAGRAALQLQERGRMR
ncbi:hypothetical protein GCM10027318_08490 [Massilia agilis]